MAQIRIDTEHNREVGRRLTAEGDRLAKIGHELQRAIGSLDTWAWDGRSRWRAEPLLNRVRPESAHVAEGLDVLGRKLVRVADTFEQEDNTAARNLEGMGWVDFESGGSSTLWVDLADNDVEVEKFKDWKTKADIVLSVGEVSFEQFKLWMESFGVVDEYVLEVLYYQDDAVEILSVSEEWSQWIVQTPISVDSGWSAFKNALPKQLTGKLPLIGLGINLGLTTYEYSDEGLFSNTEYYAALATDVLLFVGGAAVMTFVASAGLVGAPAILATVAAGVGWAFVSNWLEEPLTRGLTPAFEWAGSRIGSAKDWVGDQWEELDRAVDDAADWVSDHVDELSNSFNGFVQGLVPNFAW